MTKAEMKKQRREKIKSANNKIYKNIVSYLVGPKWKGKKYQIGDLKSKTGAFGIIKIGSSYLGCRCSIYFSTDIQIYITYKYPGGSKFQINYNYFKSDMDYTNLPEDMDDYIYRTKTFLKELLRHISCLNGFNYGNSVHVDTYEACVNIKKPENFIIPFGLLQLIEYEYDWRDTEIIDYMIAVMKSKKFKRYRGDD